MKKYSKKADVKLLKVLGLFAIVAILFTAVQLVQKNQENRSKAAGDSAPSGVCLKYKSAMPDKDVFMTNGSTFCGSGGSSIWHRNDGLRRCVNGDTILVSDCDANGNSGCLETKGNLVADDLTNKKAYYNWTAQCRNDKACTDKGGSCNVDIKGGAAVGGSCVTKDNKPGIVKANLCLSRDNFDTKRCCVPNPVPSGSCTTDSLNKYKTYESGATMCGYHSDDKNYSYTCNSGTWSRGQYCSGGCDSVKGKCILQDPACKSVGGVCQLKSTCSGKVLDNKCGGSYLVKCCVK